jgi:hypothetical protein
VVSLRSTTGYHPGTPSACLQALFRILRPIPHSIFRIPHFFPAVSGFNRLWSFEPSGYAQFPISIEFQSPGESRNAARPT